MRTVCFGIIIALIAAASPAHSHGVTYGILNAQVIAVQFAYTGGEPMSYVETKIFSPESTPEVEFQNGRTDAHGVFAFVPDIPGSWRVEAWDNLGHKGSVEVVVEQGKAGLKSTGQAGDLKGGSTMVKILLALSAIANLAFLAAFLKRPRQT